MARFGAGCDWNLRPVRGVRRNQLRKGDYEACVYDCDCMSVCDRVRNFEGGEGGLDLRL